jgi:hypothetical protein
MRQQSPTSLFYFAYGSNMCFARIRARLSSAERFSTARLPKHKLSLNKIGTDGSAKANIVNSGDQNDDVFGVVFSMSPDELDILDQAEDEGTGYQRELLKVFDEGGNAIDVFSYRALLVDDQLLPFKWYLNFLTKGAKEHGLPAEYIAGIESKEAIEDSNVKRRELNRDILESTNGNPR